MPSSSKLDYLSKYMENDKKKKKKKKKKKRHDEDDDDLLPPEPNDEADDENAEDDDDGPVVVNESELVTETKRRRYDSDNDDDVVPVKKEEDSDEGGRRQRRRYDSDDEEDAPASRRRKRHDSDESETRVKKEDDSDDGGGRRRRYDSDDSKEVSVKKEDDSDDGGGRRRRYDSEDDEDSSVERMSSGHKAGLQTGSRFSVEEAKIQQKRKAEALAMVDKYGVGDTIFRDESGRKVDKPVEVKKKKQLSKEEQARLNTGRVQMEQAQRRQQEFAEIQASSFARHKDDTGLEEIRKSEIRQGDPMAAYAAKKQSSKQSSSRPQRPVYKGPPPKPNRFGIRPGFRWDGVDRSNGWEDKILAQQFSKQHQKEQAYRYSSADM